MEATFYQTVYEIEKIHWWCVARQRIVEDVIQRRLRLAPGARVLDVGCGSGAVLEALSERFEAYGTDTSQLAIDLSRQRGLTNAFCCTLATFPRAELRFDLTTLLDVIEHVDDDLAVLREAHHYLKPGGWALVTVPAYQFLWGPHDVVNHHKRRWPPGPARSSHGSGPIPGRACHRHCSTRCSPPSFRWRSTSCAASRCRTGSRSSPSPDARRRTPHTGSSKASRRSSTMPEPRPPTFRRSSTARRWRPTRSPARSKRAPGRRRLQRARHA